MNETARKNEMANANLAGKYLTFTIREESYGVAVIKVREIVRFSNITPVPQVPPYVCGVINLRGKIIPVIDLRVRLGFGDALPGLSLSGDISRNAGYVQIAALLHIMAKTDADRKAFETQIDNYVAENNKALDDYEKTISRPEDRANFEALKKARETYRLARVEMFALDNAGKDDEALAYNTSTAHPAFDAFQKACAAVFDDNAAYGQKMSDTVQKNIRHANLFLIVVSLVVTALGITCAMIIIRGLTRSLSTVASALEDGSMQVVSASSQVSSASQTLAQGAGQQASSLEETSASLEEMASMARQNSDNARKANALAREARDAADKGATDVQTMSAAMAAIKTSSDDVAKIIKTIDEIAFQTNILALNAAVEAARAGEAGMGFAVVADEVRNLAQRCAQAAKETSLKIEGAIARTGQGVQVIGQVATGLTEIVNKVRQVDELVTEVAGASREQTEGISQINTAVGQMDSVTQSNAASAEESAAAAEELNVQADMMKRSVADLLKLVSNQHPVSATKAATQASIPGDAHSSTHTIKMPAINRSGNGTSHATVSCVKTAKTASRTRIPLDGDFKDF